MQFCEIYFFFELPEKTRYVRVKTFFAFSIRNLKGNGNAATVKLRINIQLMYIYLL